VEADDPLDLDKAEGSGSTILPQAVLILAQKLISPFVVLTPCSLIVLSVMSLLPVAGELWPGSGDVPHEELVPLPYCDTEDADGEAEELLLLLNWKIRDWGVGLSVLGMLIGSADALEVNIL
jgi:hypothetical protein